MCKGPKHHISELDSSCTQFLGLCHALSLLLSAIYFSSVINRPLFTQYYINIVHQQLLANVSLHPYTFGNIRDVKTFSDSVDSVHRVVGFWVTY